ncbi:uncharacterized protein LOC120251856 [Dioscorea cayenensis subsp. rotundata]|uniref:Uncharacterized protein LOC120251856 n=1 Tax=Dioscorea cayennensis subsp. rotundata TaxID=55577 RepID=A0AB40AN22_DIOCR|nr:uncharacterized protein LOC120251856 [Dioscorea cayenensis subsp. rotundata]
MWVIGDHLTKIAHFLPLKPGLGLEKLEELFLGEIIRLHGIPVSITSDRDSTFISWFWRSLQSPLGIILTFSTAFYPQTNGQSERTIQILEDMQLFIWHHTRLFTGGSVDLLCVRVMLENGSCWVQTVFFRISLMKGVVRFGKRGKLNPRCIGPFEIVERVGSVVYCLPLPPDIAQVHNVIHVSMLEGSICRSIACHST